MKMPEENPPEESADDKPQIEIVGDDDWKDRVKAEDAKLDAKSETEEKESPLSDKEQLELDIDQIPPATFPMLVQMFSTQAMVSLGVIPSPDGKAQQQLPLAKHFIDLLGVLEEKCKGNMDADEEKLLEQSLYELRSAYVQLSSAASQS